jgi:hypothetical protein
MAHPPADEYVPYQPSGFFVLNWAESMSAGALGLPTPAPSPVTFVSSANETLNYELSETSPTGGIHAGW